MIKYDFWILLFLCSSSFLSSYTIELHKDDVIKLPMIRMGMTDTENADWDLICDILLQIESEEFSNYSTKINNIVESMNEQRGMTKERDDWA